jgi:hypothetical protein
VFVAAGACCENREDAGDKKIREIVKKHPLTVPGILHSNTSYGMHCCEEMFP